MIDVERSTSDDALAIWGDDIVRFIDRYPLLEATRARSRGAIKGSRWAIGDRHPLESAEEQRAVLAAEIRTEINDDGSADLCATLLAFDRHWQPSTVVSRRLGGKQLFEEWQRRLDASGEPSDVSHVTQGAEIRWFATLPLDLGQLERVLQPLEQGTAALSLSADQATDAATLFHDLFDDYDGHLTTQQLWPSWAARRTSQGERVLLARGFNDHTGREAFLLSSGVR